MSAILDALADIKHPRHEEALSGVKAGKARLLSEADARRKEKPQVLETKKMQAVTAEKCEPEPVTAADDFKIDYRAAARDALKRVQQELLTKEIEQKVRLELENEKLQEKLNTFEATPDRYGATGKQNTVNNLCGGTPGNKKSE